MRHMKSGRKLGRNSAHRKAMFNNMVTSLLLHGRIKTTEQKAKELRRLADRMVTLGKRIPPSVLLTLQDEDLSQAKANRVHAIRLARKHVNNREALERLFGEYSERYQTRAGGYTRILKVGHRAGDNASMVLVELVPALEVVEEASPVAAESEEAAAAE